MKTLFKIFLIILAVFPLWVTIMAMASSPATMETWKMALNRKLLAQATDARRVQIIQLASTREELDEALLATNFEIEVMDLRGVGTVPIEVRFLDSETRLAKLVKLTGRVLVEEKATVVARAINQGEMIQAADLTNEWVNATRFGNSRPLSQDEMVGRRTRVGIRAMSPVIAGQINLPSMVRAGDRVEVRVIGDSLSVSGFGIAKQSGEKGETIKIVNPDSRKEIFGIVTDTRKVEVRL